MVGGGVYGAHSVRASRDTDCYIRGRDAVNCGTVDTLEEDELEGVQRGSLLEISQRLNDNVSMSDDFSLVVETLGRSKVRLLSVGEDTRLEVLDVKLGRELLVGSDRRAVRGEEELSARHLVNGRDETDGGRVARARRDLETVGEGRCGERQSAEVDVVVGRRRRGGLASNWGILTVIREVDIDDGGVELQRRLEINSCVGSRKVVACGQRRGGGGGRRNDGGTGADASADNARAGRDGRRAGTDTALAALATEPASTAVGAKEDLLVPFGGDGCSRADEGAKNEQRSGLHGVWGCVRNEREE